MNQRKLQALLLERCRKTNSYMADIIEWYIDVGIVLKENARTGYMITPVIKDHPLDEGWESQEEWDQEKQWLLPYFKLVKQHLINIRQEEKYVDF